MSIQTRSEPEAKEPRCHTARAFLLAPGIAALVGALVSAATVFSPSSHDLMGGSPGLEGSLELSLLLAAAFAVVGYATAAVVGVPIYLVLPERARSAFAVVVPLAGVIAAAPWFLGAAPWAGGHRDLTWAEIAFALGAVGGIAFLFVRRPRAGAEDPCREVPDRPARADAL